MTKSGKVYIQDDIVGRIWQDEKGYHFQYTKAYVKGPMLGPVSLTMPVRAVSYDDAKALHPFFDGLIPEGWLLDITVKNWKLDEKDRMELLLTVCQDCIGAVKIIREPHETTE
ncbi:MAG: HipA N-terminal domain-containing protein [Chryseolinea sp.]